jgi:hypothetical protein
MPLKLAQFMTINENYYLLRLRIIKQDRQYFFMRSDGLVIIIYCGYEASYRFN